MKNMQKQELPYQDAPAFSLLPFTLPLIKFSWRGEGRASSSKEALPA
jgi:hypothetical protein